MQGRSLSRCSRCKALEAGVIDHLGEQRGKKNCVPRIVCLKMRFPGTVAWGKEALPGILLEVHILMSHPRFIESETQGKWE